MQALAAFGQPIEHLADGLRLAAELRRHGGGTRLRDRCDLPRLIADRVARAGDLGHQPIGRLLELLEMHVRVALEARGGGGGGGDQAVALLAGSGRQVRELAFQRRGHGRDLVGLLGEGLAQLLRGGGGGGARRLGLGVRRRFERGRMLARLPERVRDRGVEGADGLLEPIAGHGGGGGEAFAMLLHAPLNREAPVGGGVGGLRHVGLQALHHLGDAGGGGARGRREFRRPGV